MFDNFIFENIKKVVEMIGGKYEIELLGGIMFDMFCDYVECGVDFILVGVFIYLVKGFDMSFKVC